MTMPETETNNTNTNTNTMKFVTVVRDLDAEPTYRFAEIQYGKIVAIFNHWVPLNQFITFFEPGALFIDITDVTVDGYIPEVGDVVDGNTIIHVAKNADERLEAAIENLKTARDQKELEPIEYNNDLFDADIASLMRMDKARKFLEDTEAANILWTTYDNNHVELTAEDFKNINIALAVRSAELHEKYNLLKTFLRENADNELIVKYLNWNTDITMPVEELVDIFKTLEAEENVDNQDFVVEEAKTIEDIPDEQKEAAREQWGGDINPNFSDNEEIPEE